MWVVTTQGFYSVVEHRDDPELLVVRARAKKDLEALRAQIPGIKMVSNGGTDYRWRSIVTRQQWAAALAVLGEDIDYDNFKKAVAARQGEQRARVYMRVWSVLYRLSEPPARLRRWLDSHPYWL